MKETKKKVKVTNENPVIAMADILKLSQTERVKLFVTSDKSVSAAFRVCCKTFVAIEKNLKGDDTVGGILVKAGIRKSTIDNARDAAFVWRSLVEPKLILEPTFDKSITHADCRLIQRVMSGKSVKKLAASEVATIIRSSPDSFDEELDSFFETGMTVAEAKAKATADAAAKAAKEQADAAAAATAAAELERLKAQNAALAANPPAAPVAETPAPEPEEEPEETPVAPSVPEVPAPVQESQPESKITQITKSRRSAAEVCADLDRLFSEIADLPDPDQAVAAIKFIEHANFMADAGFHITAPVQERVAA